MEQSAKPAAKTMIRYPEYHDHANVDLDWIKRQKLERETGKAGGPVEIFPVVLHSLLERAEQRGHSSIVSWQPHGRAFRIHNRGRFEKEILPLYFEHQSVFTSFQRQLNSYGFLRLYRPGPDQKSYYHELLLRGRPELSGLVVRSRFSEHGVRRRWDPTSEPNFGRMVPLPQPEVLPAAARRPVPEPTLIHSSRENSLRLLLEDEQCKKRRREEPFQVSDGQDLNHGSGHSNYVNLLCLSHKELQSTSDTARQQQRGVGLKITGLCDSSTYHAESTSSAYQGMQSAIHSSPMALPRSQGLPHHMAGACSSSMLSTSVFSQPSNHHMPLPLHGTATRPDDISSLPYFSRSNSNQVPSVRAASRHEQRNVPLTWKGRSDLTVDLRQDRTNARAIPIAAAPALLDPNAAPLNGSAVSAFHYLEAAAAAAVAPAKFDQLVDDDLGEIEPDTLSQRSCSST